MRNRSAQPVPVCILALVLLASACSSGEEAPAAAVAEELQVERVTEDGVEVVRNLSGSKWRGNATLALQLEIGVDEGDERYMLNQPFPFWATEDEIFALEREDGIVRVYGLDGQHRRDIGSAGQGPGEFEDPGAIAVLQDGRLAVTSGTGGAVRTAFFSLEGDFLEEWRTREAAPGERSFVMAFNAVVGADRVWAMAQRMPEESMNFWDAQVGLVAFNQDGYLDDPWFAPPFGEDPPTMSISFNGREFKQPVPWSASRPIVAGAPDGTVLWSHSDTYRFHIVSPDGVTRAVERVADPVAVNPEEADYRRQMTIAQFRRQIPDFDWDGGGIPATKPWLVAFVVEPSGRIWLMREGPGERLTDCIEDPLTAEPMEVFRNPCWRSGYLYDAFSPDGEYLGALDLPDGVNFIAPFIDGDRLVTAHEDEFGVNKIRVYRIILPGEASDT